ncbi:hypothetical protein Q0M94_06830 [Deinococcus radiomollis]|uniref:hypothetical protein n=1 Tax=Deinococcus radiomollis TaxID=468916 RepID=UPI003891ECD4
MTTDWGVEFFRVGATGLGVYIAFLLANRGRKIDVLIKESYASTKILTNMCIELKEKLIGMKLLLNFVDFNDPSSTYVDMTESSFREGEFRRHVEYLDLLRNQYLVNKKELVLLHPKLRKAYGNLDKGISRTAFLVEIVESLLSEYYNKDIQEENLSNATHYAKSSLQYIDSLILEIENFVDSCFHALKLPNYVKLYDNTNEKE